MHPLALCRDFAHAHIHAPTSVRTMSHAPTASRPVRSHRATAFAGTVRVPGDKSISHRALMFGALASGRTRITGLLEGEDVVNTAKVVELLGCPARKVGDIWEVLGRGVGGLTQPATDLEFGNSGTGCRLMMGVVAGHDVQVKMTGDASLSKRPMRRVLDPLKTMGVKIVDERETLPLVLRGSSRLIPIVYETSVPSAQVKSAVLLAGLAAAGATTVIEKEATRDHTERMLRYFGAEIATEHRNGKTAITVKGHAELTGRDVTVPGDPSSAAFVAAAAAIVPGADVTIQGVLVNETRIGFYTTLQEMGCDVTYLNAREQNGEPIADIRVRQAKLTGVRVPPARAPSMIDEYPVLACVAAYANGETRMEGLGELKVKESDRLAATVEGLAANGVSARVEGETMIVAGGKIVRGGGTVATHMDHRIAMAFLILGLGADAPVTIDDITFVATSFPTFQTLMTGMGAKFEAV
jgi:3-phosphoshikimate 1-carboxyvinyltransferase